MIKFNVKTRWSDNLQFSADISCAEDAPAAVKLGLAVRWGYLNEADLRRANLTGASLSYANLAGADLSNADLSGADLSGTALRGANLTRATLLSAKLTGANLSCSNLICAVLDHADLANVNLRHANLSGATGVIDAGTQNRYRCFGWLRDGRLSVRAGCRDKRIDEGRAYWAGVEGREEILEALTYIETRARLLGWRIR